MKGRSKSVRDVKEVKDVKEGRGRKGLVNRVRVRYVWFLSSRSLFSSFRYQFKPNPPNSTQLHRNPTLPYMFYISIFPAIFSPY